MKAERVLRSVSQQARGACLNRGFRRLCAPVPRGIVGVWVDVIVLVDVVVYRGRGGQTGLQGEQGSLHRSQSATRNLLILKTVQATYHLPYTQTTHKKGGIDGTRKGWHEPAPSIPDCSHRTGHSHTNITMSTQRFKSSSHSLISTCIVPGIVHAPGMVSGNALPHLA